MDLLKPVSLLLGLAVLPTCDPLVGSSYRGQPLFSFEGQLLNFSDVGAQGFDFRTTLLWLTDPTSDPVTGGPRLESAVEHASAAVELRFPAGFRVDVFAPPEERMLIPGTGLGIALIAIYEDRDGNGVLSLDAKPSELVGGSQGEALVYARDAAAAAAAPFTEPITPGFQLARMPIGCEPSSPTGECLTELGAPCTADSDCGFAARCILELDGVVWPGGACALAGPTFTCELPDNGAVHFTSERGVFYFVAGCDSVADCREGYRCDDFELACLPENAPVPSFAPSIPRGASCDVNVGAACIGDGECGIGECLIRSNGNLFPGGYCTLPIFEGVSPCEPDGGRAIEWSFTEGGGDSHWFKGCAADADCRLAEGYLCDPWLDVCLPPIPVSLILQPEVELAAPCDGNFLRITTPSN